MRDLGVRLLGVIKHGLQSYPLPNLWREARKIGYKFRKQKAPKIDDFPKPNVALDKDPLLKSANILLKRTADNCYIHHLFTSGEYRFCLSAYCLLLQFKSSLDFTIGAIKGTVKALLLAPLHSLVKDSLYNIIFHLQEFEINHMTWLNRDKSIY
jgi:hypothetical protein